MAVKRVERRGSFIARDASGTEYTINVFVQILSVVTRGDPQGETDGLIELRTNDREPVNHQGPNQFSILTRFGAQIDVTSDEPNPLEAFDGTGDADAG